LVRPLVPEIGPLRRRPLSPAGVVPAGSDVTWMTPSAAPKLIGAAIELPPVVFRMAPLVTVIVPAPVTALGVPVLLVCPLPISSALIVLAAATASLPETSTLLVAADAPIEVAYSAPL